MEGRQGGVVGVPCAAFHKVVLECQLVGLIHLLWLSVICLQHFGDHHFGQGVLVDTAGSLVYKYVVEYLCEASETVLERNGCV